MSLDERFELVKAIWDTIEADSARLPLSEELRSELDQRIADMEANPDDEMSWEAVKTSIRAAP